MGFNSSAKPLSLLLSFLSLSSIFELHPVAASSSHDITTLVYKGCANQNFTGQTAAYSSSQSLSALFGTLVLQSAKEKFYKTTTGTGQINIRGLFQCRGDLSNDDCSSCVQALPKNFYTLCASTVAARIQLSGCYMLYGLSSFPQVSGMDMLFKSCSGNMMGEGISDEEMRDTALSQIKNNLTNGHGFFPTNYQSVYAFGQCEGDLGSSDCGDCIENAIQKVKAECGRSRSGQLYLNKCYVSYNNRFSGQGGKTVAIILGGVALVAFLIVFLMFARNVMKKRDDN